MPSYEEHCRQSQQAFGKRFEEVHRWLDEFADTVEYGMKHRRKRHHAEGIRQAVERFGKEAEAVARLHVVEDLKLEGWTESDSFPKNETDYVAMGLF